MDFSISLLGLFVGLLVGMTGVGGAALLTPLLVLIGINPTIAVGTDLFYNSITKLFGTIQHWRQRSINLVLVKRLATGSVPGAVTAILLLRAFNQYYHESESLIKHALAIVLIIAAAATLAKPLIRRKFKEAKERPEEAGPRKVWVTILVGFVLGFIVGLTSIGSGSLYAIAMFYLYKLNSSEIVGTDIAHAFLLVTAAGFLHAGMGNVDFDLAARLLLGSIPGVLIGSRLSILIPPTPLRAVMASLILLSGLKML